ncbi:MAG: hypothetical protein H5U40_11440 [Polyangiaceae bacterium]|nr:hypothetical protein [Polyangiaceae bacterium]
MHRVVWMVLAVGLIGCGGATTAALNPASASENAGAELGLNNEHHPLPGITTGGAPTEAVFHAASQAGYRTVVSLLIEGETGLASEQRSVESRGMRFVHIPVAGEAGLTEDNARALGAVTSDPDARPILLHCSSANRSGALLALASLYVDGKSVDEALAIGRDAGLSGLEAATRAQLERSAAGR